MLENDNKAKPSSFLYTWGFGKYGQIGSFEYQYVAEPLEFKLDKLKDESKNSIEEIEFIHCGEFHSGYLTKDKNLYMFGKNTFGQLGISDNISVSKPTRVNLDRKIIKLALGGEHSLALTDNYELYSWGLNIFGQLGLGDFNERNYPHKVSLYNRMSTTEKTQSESNLEVIIDIAAGAQHSMILTENSNILTCGYGKNFSLGIWNEKENKQILEEKNLFSRTDKFFNKFFEESSKKFTKKNISCGVYHSACAISSSEIIIWGKGNELDYSQPMLIDITDKKNNTNPSANTFPEIKIGENFFVIMSPQGEIFTSNTNQISKKFEKVPINERIKDISLGYSHVIAIGESKKLYAWGNNRNGQILDEKHEELTTPKEITLFIESSPLRVSCGGYHTILLTKNEMKNLSLKLNTHKNQALRFPINKNFDPEEFNKTKETVEKILEKKDDLNKQIKEKENSIEEMKKFLEENKKLSNSDSSMSLNRDSRNMKRKSDKNNKVNLALLFDEDIKFEELQLIDKGDVGTGTFGDVKLSYWRKTLVAVKFLKKTVENEAENIKSFIEELYILKNLRHPNILLYLGACTAGPQYFLVSEYCEKGNLFDFLHTNKKNILSLKEKIRIALEIAKGVNYLHCFNPPILHRDLKSLNILLDKNFQVKIADFGWARIRQDHMTKQRGTFQWMAPEVIRRNTYSEKADVFSFGIILWELMVQEPPYRNIDRIQVAKKVATDPKYRPKIPSDVPSKIKELMPLCWDHDPDQRLSFDQIIEYLEIFYSQL